MSSAVEIRNHLTELQAERALAKFDGLSVGGAHMVDLDEEIAQATHAHVGSAVTEIALLRAELSGPQVG